MLRTIAIIAVALAAVVLAHAQDAPRVLVIGGGLTEQAVKALDVPCDSASWADYARGDVNLFRYHVVIGAMDSSRGTVIAGRPGPLVTFVRAGGVFLGMRQNEGDPWLPVPAANDKAFQLGEIVAPEHPVFHQPNELTREVLADVHGGSIYRAFRALGEGWVPLISTGAEQAWDATVAAEGPRYGLIELPLGAGRIVLCQMIPEYHWFNDRGGEDCAGKLMCENLLAYALAQAPGWPTDRVGTMPESYRDDLSELLPEATAGGAWPLDEAGWSFESQGKFTGQPDRRAVFTISHPHEPSEAGAFGRVSRTVPVAGAGTCWLRFYVSDDYCGGKDLQMEGDRRVAEFENRKADMRFAEVLVDGEQVFELDVLGRNPEPASRRFYLVDITEAARGKDAVTVSLQVRDRAGSGDAPFATDVFFAGVEVFDGLRSFGPAELTAEGFAPTEGGVALAEGAAQGSLTATWDGPAGEYYLATHLRDEHTGQSELRMAVGGREVGAVRMTGDDWNAHWWVAGRTQVNPGDAITLTATREGTETVTVSEVMLLPRALVEREPARPAVAIAPSCYQPTEEPASASFTVTVTDHAGAARSGEIATQGLPFAYGALREARNVRVLGPDGAEVPVQARALNRWPDGSVMFALVSFPATVAAGGSAQYTVEYGAQVRPAARMVAADLLTVDEQDGRIVVNTGPLQATLSTTRGTLLDSAVLDGRELASGGEPWAALVTAEDGTEYSSAAGEVTKTQVIEAGPLRAVIRRIGRHTAADGRTLLEFDLLQEFYAGSPQTRLSYVFTHKEDSATERVRQVRLTMPTPWAGEGARATVWGEGAAASGAAAACRQLELDAATVTADGADTQAGRTLGFARLSDGPSLAVTTRWWWEKWPKGVEVSADGIALDLIPADSHTQFSDGPFVLYQGEGITHEVMLGFEPEGTAPDATDAFVAFRDRLIAAPDPAYATSTLALGEMPPAGEHLFPDYEQRIDRMYDGYMAKRESRREYGMENFGDDTFEWGYGPSYTFWSNQEYDHHHGFLVQWYRSGDRRFFEIGEQAARHYEATDCYHWAPGREHLIGAPHHHNSKHIVDEGWYPDHCVAGASNGHSWVEGLLDYWLLTGDVRAEETARAMGEWYIWTVENNAYGAGGQERGPGWTLIALSSLYRLTGDERFAAAGERILDWIEATQDPVRGVLSVPISEQPSYEGGTAFMHGIVGRGLGRFYEATGSERAMRACLGIGEWLTTEPMGPPAKFWYKQAPSCKTGYGATDQCINALSYPYRYTGDEWFGWLADELLSMTGVGSRSAAWVYTTLGHLAPRRTPLAITPPGSTPVFAPDAPWEGTVALRNTTDAPVTARLSVVAPAGIRALCTPEELTIAPGAEGQAALTLVVARGVDYGASEVVVQVATPGKTQRRPLMVRTLESLVEVGAGPEVAELVAPVAMTGAGAEAWIGVPRAVRFNPDPWAASDDAGRATWTLDVPRAGRYTVMAQCWWEDDKGDSFYLSVDGAEPVVFGNAGQMRRWAWIAGPEVDLTAGAHTISLITREDGARVNRIRLTNAPQGD